MAIPHQLNNKDKETDQMKRWYETLFENYANRYELERYVQGTSGEYDFIEKELNFDKSLRILNIGCGT
jgi:hypothetical protein